MKKEAWTYTNGKKIKEYVAWKDMKYLCNTPTCRDYPRYGERGITYADKFEKFIDFIQCVGYAPSHYHSFIRIDKDGNYEPGNVRWCNVRNRMKK